VSLLPVMGCVLRQATEGNDVDAAAAAPSTADDLFAAATGPAAAATAAAAGGLAAALGGKELPVPSAGGAMQPAAPPPAAAAPVAVAVAPAVAKAPDIDLLGGDDLYVPNGEHLWYSWDSTYAGTAQGFSCSWPWYTSIDKMSRQPQCG